MSDTQRRIVQVSILPSIDPANVRVFAVADDGSLWSALWLKGDGVRKGDGMRGGWQAIPGLPAIEPITEF